MDAFGTDARIDGNLSGSRITEKLQQWIRFRQCEPAHSCTLSQAKSMSSSQIQLRDLNKIQNLKLNNQFGSNENPSKRSS